MTSINPKLLSSIYIASAILVFFLLVLPAFDKTKMLKAGLAERENMLFELQKITKRFDELNQDIDQNKNDIAKLDQLLPKQKEISEVITAIENIVSSSGLNLAEVTFSESKGDQVSTIRGNIKLAGNYNSLTSLLDLLEKNLRLFEINTIDIASQLSGEASAINYDIKFEANYLNSEL